MEQFEGQPQRTPEVSVSGERIQKFLGEIPQIYVARRFVSGEGSLLENDSFYAQGNLMFVYHPLHDSVVVTIPNKNLKFVDVENPKDYNDKLTIPGFLVWEFHGQRCESISGKYGGGDRYPRISDPDQIEAFIDRRYSIDAKPLKTWSSRLGSRIYTYDLTDNSEG